MMIQFCIPGEPVGKGRVRVTFTGGVPNAYTPEKTAAYENLVKLAYKQITGVPMLEGAIDAEIYAYFAIPKSLSKKKRSALIGKPCEKKPDADNIAKSVLDALNKVAYHDDSSVVSLRVEKIWANRPHVRVVLKERERRDKYGL